MIHQRIITDKAVTSYVVISLNGYGAVVKVKQYFPESNLAPEDLTARYVQDRDFRKLIDKEVEG